MRKVLIGTTLLALALAAADARAGTIDWTTWANTSSPAPATGTMGAIGVTYNGDYTQVVPDYPSWNPSSSYTGGTISNAPPQSGGIVQLMGGNTDVNTINFSTPVTDPVMAIWSLGAPNSTAYFDFTANEPFAIEAGGPSAEYGGSSITASGVDVAGAEGNGVIQFDGTFSSISFTNPTYENWYGFTVGYNTDPSTSPVPEPSSFPMLLAGLAAIGGALYLARKKMVA